MKDIAMGMVWISIGVLVWAMGFFAGTVAGETKGMKKQIELEKKITCEVKYDNEIQQNISGECLKYFLK